jgi:hypothetical protein
MEDRFPWISNIPGYQDQSYQLKYTEFFAENFVEIFPENI